jgi:hypothetical protein
LFVILFLFRSAGEHGIGAAAGMECDTTAFAAE